MWQQDEKSEANRLVDAYIRKHYYHLLQISCIYPNMDGRIRILSIIQLLIYILILVHELVILIKSTIVAYGFNMVLFSQNVHFCLLNQISLIVIGNFIWKNSSMFRLHKLLSYDFYDYQEPGVIGEELLRSTMKTERRRLTLIPFGAVLTTGVVMIISPIVDYKAGTFDFNRNAPMFDYHLPLPYLKHPYYVGDGFGFYFAIFGQMAHGFVLSAVIGVGGLLFINISENICLQLELLNNSLDNIESRIEHLYSRKFRRMNRKSVKSLRYDSRYAYCYTNCLRKNVEHHQVILKAFKIFEDIASLPIGSSYFTGTIVIALSLVSTGSGKELPGTTIASILLCTIEVSYMFLFSAIGQRFIDLSTELRYKMYNTRWYMCSNEIKRSLMIFEEMTLKPMTMTVASIVPANMETFTSVMNAAYSYYNLVMAFYKK
ncbi:odorant receptor 49a-like [Halyomorpha halys]|uniref:odorant receptor 49a-like n=1 Tax=Halyomorpha halys TaxID=286706 RepID=UPI0034D1C181|nr:Odorant receptor 9 [Halyomorpha halys]